jgi:RNA polymerase sigma-70 factor (ECF subfamily)
MTGHGARRDEGDGVEVGIVMERSADIGSLLRGHVADAYRLARAILLDDGEAEDAVQEAAISAWRRHGSLREPAKFDAWFDRILVNQCRDQLRKRRRAVQVAPPPVGFEPAGAPPDTGADADLDRAIAALDLDHRVVVVMRYWQDRTVDDIADRLGIPAGTVKSRLHHALKHLRTAMEATDGRP